MANWIFLIPLLIIFNINLILQQQTSVSRLKSFFGSLEISSEQYLHATATLEAAYHLKPLSGTLQVRWRQLSSAPLLEEKTQQGSNPYLLGLATSTSQTPCKGRHREMACLMLSPLPVSPLESSFCFQIHWTCFALCLLHVYSGCCAIRMCVDICSVFQGSEENRFQWPRSLVRVLCVLGGDPWHTSWIIGLNRWDV